MPTIVNKIIADTVVSDAFADAGHYYVADFENIDKEQLTSWLKMERPERSSRNQYDWQNVADAYAKCYEQVVRL